MKRPKPLPLRTVILLISTDHLGNQKANKTSRRSNPICEHLPASSALLADLELSSVPLHLTVVGPKDDALAQRLFKAALGYPSSYKRLEWWDRREGNLRNPDVQYPELKTAAAFICTNTTCSSPIFQVKDLAARVDRLLAVSTPSMAEK